MDDTDFVKELLIRSISFTRALERIGAMGADVAAVKASADRILELEPDLNVEMTAVVEHLEAVIDLMARSVTFLDARQDAWMDRMRTEADGDDG